MKTFYASRSAVELWDRCNRKRFLAIHYAGKGLQGKALSIPLATGSNTHFGVETILNYVRKGLRNLDQLIDIGVAAAQGAYLMDLQLTGFSGKGTNTPAGQLHTQNEQMALVEVLIRLWGRVELPLLLERYNIVAVEREDLMKLPTLKPPEEGSTGIDYRIIFQGRADAVLEEKDSKHWMLYSLKTIKRYGEKEEESYRDDLQGITETLTAENTHRVWNKKFPNKKIPEKIVGVRYCFLVKGYRQQDRYSHPEEKLRTHYTVNPFLRGWKRIGPASIEYAHSYYYPNPANLSGQGRLGRGWEPFNSWEEEQVGFTKGWMELIAAGGIQPECGDVVSKYSISPPEYFRNQREIESTYRQVASTENTIVHRLLATPESENLVQIESHLDITFPKARSACHWPLKCIFHPICFRPEIAEDPIGSGMYEFRRPHHYWEEQEFSEG